MLFNPALFLLAQPRYLLSASIPFLYFPPRFFYFLFICAFFQQLFIRKYSLTSSSRLPGSLLMPAHNPHVSPDLLYYGCLCSHGIGCYDTPFIFRLSNNSGIAVISFVFLFYTSLSQAKTSFIYCTDDMVALLIFLSISPLGFSVDCKQTLYFPPLRCLTFHSILSGNSPKFRGYHGKYSLERIMRRDSIRKLQIIAQKILMFFPKHFTQSTQSSAL